MMRHLTDRHLRRWFTFDYSPASVVVECRCGFRDVTSSRERARAMALQHHHDECGMHGSWSDLGDLRSLSGRSPRR